MDGPFHIMTEDQRAMVLHHIGVIVVTYMPGDGIRQHPGPGGSVRDDIHAAAQEACLFVEEGRDGHSDERERAGVDLVGMDNGVHVRAYPVNGGVHAGLDRGLERPLEHVQLEIQHADIFRLHFHIIVIGGGDGQGGLTGDAD